MLVPMARPEIDLQSQTLHASRRLQSGATVDRVVPDGAMKEVHLTDGTLLRVSRYSVVSKDDLVVVDGRGAVVQLRNGRARIKPAYLSRHQLTIGTAKVAAEVREITADAHLVGYRRLLDFHYRGERGFGRRAVVIVTARAPELPPVLGFVELTTGFLMSKPRTRILSSPFQEGDIGWQSWDGEAMRSLTSVIARISRLVVHPELRGLGIGTLLVRESIRYAHERFHAGGLRPLFLEITADMMKFVPFASRGGMVYVGETEGNLHRVVRDVRYLLSDSAKDRGSSLTSSARGIMSAQRRYARAFEASKIDLADLSEALKSVNGNIDPDLFQRASGMLRLPKPTYLAGLSVKTHRWVLKRVAELGIVAPAELEISPVAPVSQPITVKDLTVTFRTQMGNTSRSSAVASAFGIPLGNMRSRVLDGVNLEVRPGAVALIYGPSGSGKTTLLRLLDGSGLPAGAEWTGSVSIPKDAIIGRFRPIRSRKPLVEVIAPRADVRSAIYALNAAGLTDAHLYLRRFDELSDGQKYRAMLASLIGSGANVWIADEFLSLLDPFTASVVAANVASHARRHGVTLIVGAPHFEAFIQALRPDSVLRLSTAWEYEISSGDSFIKRWQEARRDGD